MSRQSNHAEYFESLDIDLDRVAALAKLHAHSVFYTTQHIGYDCHEILRCVTCCEGGQVFSEAFEAEILKVQQAYWESI